MIFHRGTVEKTRRMHFNTGILKVITEQPEILPGLQRRMEEHAIVALKALQVGCAVCLLQREGGQGFPAFRARGSDLPKPIRGDGASVRDVFNCARRLGAWFATDELAVLQRQLNIEF